MKLSFSTLGCPGWSWKEILAAAKDLNYQGIELRGVGTELVSASGTPFLSEHLEETISHLEKAGLALPILTTGACLGHGDRNENINEAMSYIDLAQKLKTPYIRVMVDPSPKPASPDMEEALSRMKLICGYAQQRQVMVLAETNSVFADSAKLAEFLKQVASPAAGALWDIHHPWRYQGEMPEQTARNLEGFVRHVHVKDSVVADGGLRYKMVGHGDVPIQKCVSLLKEMGYDGYLSLEWVKRWQPDLEEPGIVFAHYAGYMAALLEK